MAVKTFMRSAAWKDEVRKIDNLRISMEQKVEMFIALYQRFEKQSLH